MTIRRGEIAVVDTRAGLRMRRSPAGRQAYHKGKPLVRPHGWDARVTKICTIASGPHEGERWAKFGHYWMSCEYLREKRKKRRGGRHPASPVPGYGVNYAYGVPNSGYSAGFHTGEDRAAPNGARVVAVAPGRVVRADDNGGAYGNWIQILRDSGTVDVYCHLSRIRVRVGQRVKPGQRVGNVGSTGNTTGPHHHHEQSDDRHWNYGDVQEPRWRGKR